MSQSVSEKTTTYSTSRRHRHYQHHQRWVQPLESDASDYLISLLLNHHCIFRLLRKNELIHHYNTR